MRMRRQKTVASDRLEEALEGAPPTGDPEIEGLVSTAGLLSPGVPIRESRRSEIKDRMLREAARTSMAAASDDAGSHDGSETRSVHTAEVSLPDGTIWLADVEPISEERAAAIAREVAAFQDAHNNCEGDR